MNTKEAWERIIEGNFNNGYGFDLQMLVDCMGIVSKAIKDGEIIPTQVVRDAIAEMEEEKTNGEVLEAVFPNIDFGIKEFDGSMWVDMEDIAAFKLDWWNAPYERSTDADCD